MARNVKRAVDTPARSRISSKHQITIARRPFEEAGFAAGQVVDVRATGPGRVELTSVEALLARYRGAISTGGALRRELERARDEWA